MPRTKANVAKKPPKKATVPKSSHPTCAPLHEGTILRDVLKHEWKVGRHIGKGGFGLIYCAQRVSDSEKRKEYVIKIEPLSNGPLFCEVHFYQRAAKADMIDSWKKERKMKSLGMPCYVACGNHTHAGQNCRFLVMERFGEDLQNIFERQNRRFPPISIFLVGMKVIDTLEYIHHTGYAHADIKAANLLRGLGPASEEVYLVDFGLTYRFETNGERQVEREDPKRRHDGTLEFCSRDAHRGVAPSPRGDLEILGFCMLQWLGGRLPWESALGNSEADKQAVAGMKEKCMKDIKGLAAKCGAAEMPDFIKFLEEISKLQYMDTPNYSGLKQLLLSSIQRLGGKPKSLKLVFDSTTVPPAPSPVKSTSPMSVPSRNRKRGAENVPCVSSPPKRKSGEGNDIVPDSRANLCSPNGDRVTASQAARVIRTPLKQSNSASPATPIRASPRLAARARNSPRASPIASSIVPAAGAPLRRQSAGIQTSPDLFKHFKMQRRKQKAEAKKQARTEKL